MRRTERGRGLGVLAALALLPLLLALAACDVPITGLGGSLGGPFAGSGNRVTALALDAARPGRVALGTRLGVFVSDDGGAHWPQSARGAFADVGVRDLSASPLPGGPLWLVAGDGTVWLSGDGGESWRPAGGAAGGAGALPAGAAWVQAGAAGADQAFAAVPGHGLYASDDAGLSWRALPPLPNKGEARRLVVDPAAPRTLLLLTPQALLRSTDGGAHWQPVSFPGQPAGAPLALAGCATTSGVAYYATEAALYRTPDAGQTFTAVAAGHRFTLLAAGPSGATVYGVEGLQVLRSTDSGRTWALATATADTVSALVAGGDASGPDAVYAGLDSPAGLLVSGDGGATWRQNGG